MEALEIALDSYPMPKVEKFSVTLKSWHMD